MLQLEKKLFDYFNQEVFRDDNGTAVSSGIQRVAGPPAAAVGWRWPPAPPNAPAFPGPCFPVPSQPVGRLLNPHPPVTSPLGPSWGRVLPPAGLRPPASLPVPASVALNAGVLPGERQRARSFGRGTPGSGPAHRGLGFLWKEENHRANLRGHLCGCEHTCACVCVQREVLICVSRCLQFRPPGGHGPCSGRAEGALHLRCPLLLVRQLGLLLTHRRLRAVGTPVGASPHAQVCTCASPLPPPGGHSGLSALVRGRLYHCPHFQFPVHPTSPACHQDHCHPSGTSLSQRPGMVLGFQGLPLKRPPRDHTPHGSAPWSPSAPSSALVPWAPLSGLVTRWVLSFQLWTMPLSRVYLRPLRALTPARLGAPCLCVGGPLALVPGAQKRAHV